MTWQFASADNIGDRNEQQDRVAILHSKDSDAHLLVIADGMGGHEDGAAAAQTVIDVATRQFRRGVTGNPEKFLEKTCLDAHSAISILAEDRTSAPGSTCAILYLIGTEAYWAHVGDSRIYQFRDNKLLYRTSDHSFAQLMREQGNNATDSLEASAAQNQLYMCLGGQNEVTPEFCAAKVEAGDLFLLCSDGFWNQTEVEHALADTDGLAWDQAKAEQLAEVARQQDNSDNISLAWAYWQDTADRNKPGRLKWLTGWLSRKTG